MPRLLMARMMLKFSVTSRGDKPSDGSSISRALARASARGQSRPWPVRHRHGAGELRAPFGKTRKNAEDFLHTCAGDCVRSLLICAEAQVLLDRQSRKDSASFG